MKWFIHILILYFSVLAFWPCSDGGTDTCGQSPISYEQSNHPTENTNDDHCPTFCFCSCCGTTFVFMTKKLSPPDFFPEPPSTTAQFVYQPYLGLTFQSDIWQPPQLL